MRLPGQKSPLCEWHSFLILHYSFDQIKILYNTAKSFDFKETFTDKCKDISLILAGILSLHLGIHSTWFNQAYHIKSAPTPHTHTHTLFINRALHSISDYSLTATYRYSFIRNLQSELNFAGLSFTII